MEENSNLMKDKICFITGATSGIGEASALALANLGASVIVAARNQKKAEHTVAEIILKSSNPNVEYVLADLSIQADVRKMAQDVMAKYERLDVLLNNAGAIHLWRQISTEGIEKTWATNHLGYFLLTKLLMPLLEKSPQARIINVSSSAHWRGRINFDDLELKRGYSFMKAYSQSKLANILFTRELDNRLNGGNVTTNAVHPGYVATGLGQNFWPVKLAAPLIFRNAKSVEEGAETLVFLASSPEVEGVSSKYFVDLQEAPSSERSQDMDTARRLWDVSEEMVK